MRCPLPSLKGFVDYSVIRKLLFHNPIVNVYCFTFHYKAIYKAI